MTKNAGPRLRDPAFPLPQAAVCEFTQPWTHNFNHLDTYSKSGVGNYRVTIQVVPNLLLTSKQKLR